MSNFHARHCCDGCQTKSRARGRPASRIARDAGGERRHLAPVQDAVGVRVCPPEEARQPVAPHGLVGVDDAIAVLVELCEELVGLEDGLWCVGGYLLGAKPSVGGSVGRSASGWVGQSAGRSGNLSGGRFYAGSSASH